jgi:LysM repeat protein
MSSKIEFDLASLSRRDVILIIISVSVILGVIVGLIIFLTQGSKRPTKAIPTVLPLATSSLVAVVAPSPNLPPTLEATSGPTPTLEPYQYQVKKGETLFAIIQFFGYRDLAVVPELLLINGMASVNTPLHEGQILLIPRQTPTPGPSATPTILGTAPGPTQDYTGCSPSKRCTSPDGQYWIHDVKPGDTIVSIAFAYNSRQQDIFAANGLNASSLISLGQKLKIPILVTLTPTLTPTGSLDSTATPTPTLSPPSLLAPANNATIAHGQPVILQWATVHPLDGPQNYLVLVTNLSTGDEFRAVTRANIYHLPEDKLQPGIGQSARFEWQILVIVGSDPNAQPVSGLAGKWDFTWGP